ncbi:kinesin-like protein KIF12 [Diorhabda carinulata]|uniref:kinesin-like protein KIF12 n=1 Tax=Diorhabda carinulata TaxID=1163345 RepID=UPI0025A2482D|nr:kinesin-like protein KIF12 [Diorhabda carinulata]
MVTRRSPSTSRGTSPAKNKNNDKITTSNTDKKSPMKSRIGNSPEKRNGNKKENGSRRSSPARTNSLVKSRDSENGSIERLDEDNNFQRIITKYNDIEDNINVVVRVRPLGPKELKNGEETVVQFPGCGQILVDGIPGGPSGGQKPKLFSYNVVFEPAATQEDILQYSGMKRLIEMAVEGFRCTCFCYGQTGSGKTHTLTGPPGLFGLKPAPYSDEHGLIFRSFIYLFQLIQEQPDIHFVLKASFLEIYNEKVIDLLNPGSLRKSLAVRWSKKSRGFFVENLFSVDCEEFDDLLAVLEEGMRNRSVGKHNMNEYSSRSHTILSVYITCEQPAENGVFISRTGKINFVDLAGSEMTKKTQSEGKTLEEANNINKSLMVLGYCISSLSDSKRLKNHIPYRDSKLTKLLADSLAGNGVTLMIACISPSKSNIHETLNTLRYAARAKKIRTKPIVVMDPRESLILSLKREISTLQNENQYLKSALNAYSESKTTVDSSVERRILKTPPHVDLEELANLEGPQLAELVKLYMQENEALRKDNAELFTSRDLLQRDHEVVCRENERLLKKLEEVNSSPLIPTRPAFSAEVMNGDGDVTNIWTNSEPEKFSNIPESIKKELDKRQIGNSNQIKSHLKHNTTEENQTKNRRLQTPQTQDKNIKKPTSDLKDDVELNEDQRRFSVARRDSKQKNNSEVFGSMISLNDEEIS